ncbi:unnamed protein product [Adineta steineri]|uniref:L,D-TPase catalytic domain-containing protein n=1 Tax=Adineta steineri TaxID=433720 RepID=A0A818SMV5_9BILA|nr:unnamed protein product [Adineta steineri]CAF1411256.1 unnamed protein product [Adineta steineri]CAF1478614.1 unnamed protein product [Adineta steineri]CAF3673387.1 unnamed protein product [Adineta steineri]CAF3777892.1 unnamed protein product [Adineta steineri]
MATDENNFCNEQNRVANLKVVSGSSAILHFGDRYLSAVIGKNGVRTDKHEGDGCTPSGFLPLRRVLYRSDRIDTPSTSLPCQSLTQNDGWCDDITHSDYNQQIRLPHPAKHEKLWLTNGIYDIIGILGYNDDPVISGKGSAIFLHITMPDMEPTDGCIALSLEDLYWVLEQGLEAIFISH